MQKIIDHELAQFVWMESIATNPISDLKSPKIDVDEQKTNEKNPDLTDSFICHIIFYVIICYSIFIYVLIDLDFGTFLKTTINSFFKFKRTLITSFFSSLTNKYRLG